MRRSLKNAVVFIAVAAAVPAASATSAAAFPFPAGPSAAQARIRAQGAGGLQAPGQPRGCRPRLYRGLVRAGVDHLHGARKVRRRIDQSRVRPLRPSRRRLRARRRAAADPALPGLHRKADRDPGRVLPRHDPVPRRVRLHHGQRTRRARRGKHQPGLALRQDDQARIEGQGREGGEEESDDSAFLFARCGNSVFFAGVGRSSSKPAPIFLDEREFSLFAALTSEAVGRCRSAAPSSRVGPAPPSASTTR